MIYTLTDEKLNIDIHLQCLYFNLGEHKVNIQAIDQNENKKFPPNADPIIFDTSLDKNRNVKNLSIGEFVFFVKMDGDDLKEVNRLIFNITIDDTIEENIALFLTRGDKSNGK